MVEPVRTCRGRRESNRIETQFGREVTIDFLYITDLRSESNARANRIGAVLLQKIFDFWRNNVITSPAIVKDPHLVVEFLIAIDADRDTDTVLGKEGDDLFIEKSGVSSETKLDAFAQFRNSAR